METLQLKVQEIAKLLPGEADPALFTPATEKDEAALFEELLGFMNTVQDGGLNALLQSFFEDAAFVEPFKNAPAAKRMHHDYAGGLLEHTVAVARLTASACDIYPELDRDLLITGALLHDVGKVEELLQFPHKDYSTEGRLMGHILLGLEMIGEKLASIPEISPERGLLLKHLIASHHGLPEFGSPVPPMTLEGFVLNLMDDLDAKLAAVKKSLAKVEGEGPGFSPYHRLLERHLYRTGGPLGDGPGEGEDEP
jgi:3'-5' exoribonuclease